MGAPGDAPADFHAASRHEHLVVYDPASIPEATPFDPDLETGEPRPLPEPALRALAADGHALILHFPVEDCEAKVRVVTGEAPPLLRQRGRSVLDGARLRVPGGRLKADGAEFLHGAGRRRASAEESAVRVPAGDYAVSVLNLIPWKLAHGPSLIDAATTPAARRFDRLATVVAITGAVLIPVNILLVPPVIGVAWKKHGPGDALSLAALVAAVDAAVLGGAAILQAIKRRRPALGGAFLARTAFERENPDVVVALRPWTGGEARPAWARLDWK